MIVETIPPGFDCIMCGSEDLQIKKIVEIGRYRGVKVTHEAEVIRCNKCGNDMAKDEQMKHNLSSFKEAYRKLTGVEFSND